MCVCVCNVCLSVRLLPSCPPLSNGILTEHCITEVNGQNMIGLKDKEIAEVFAQSPRTVTITIMPKFVYDHMISR